MAKYRAGDRGHANGIKQNQRQQAAGYFTAYRRQERLKIAAYREALFAPAPEKRIRVEGVSVLAVLSDLQMPFEDPEALDQALQVLEHAKPDCVVLNGDVVDCYRETDAFLRDWRVAKDATPEQHRRARLLMDRLRHIPQKIWLGGNHEERWWKCIKDERQHGGHSAVTENLLATINAEAVHDPTKRLDLEDHIQSFERIYDMRSFGFRYWPYSHRLYFADDNLVVCHGQYVSRHSGQSAKRHFEWLGRSCIIGHTHRMGEYVVTQDGRERGAWEGGCLCQLEPPAGYAHAPNWQQGFCLAQVGGSRFRVVPIKIIRDDPHSSPAALYSGLDMPA